MALNVLHQCVACERCYPSPELARNCLCDEKVTSLYECPGCKSVWRDRAFVERHALEDCYRMTDEQRKYLFAALARVGGAA